MINIIGRIIYISNKLDEVNFLESALFFKGVNFLFIVFILGKYIPPTSRYSNHIISYDIYYLLFM